MTGARPDKGQVPGSLDVADGAGIVRITYRYDVGRDELWSALTDPERLAGWYGRVEGDLRPGGQFHLHVEDADSDLLGRVEACEPRRRLVVTMRETDESYERGQGVPPYDASLEVVLTADGPEVTLALEVRGMPVDAIAYYGAGWQIHAETLEHHLAGRAPVDTTSRWDELVPRWKAVAAAIG